MDLLYLGFILSVITAILGYFANLRKHKLDKEKAKVTEKSLISSNLQAESASSKAISEAVDLLVPHLNKRIDDLSQQVKEIANLRQQVNDLIKLVGNQDKTIASLKQTIGQLERVIHQLEITIKKQTERQDYQDIYIKQLTEQLEVVRQEKIVLSKLLQEKEQEIKAHQNGNQKGSLLR